MSGIVMEEKMLACVNSVKTEMQEKISHLKKSQKNAAKAYKIALSIVDQAGKLVCMKFSNVSYDSKYYSVREDRIFYGPAPLYFSEKAKWYDSLENTDLKEAFLVYAHAVQMVRCAFLDKKGVELEKAIQMKQVEAEFECRLIIGTLEDLLSQWQRLEFF